MFGLTKQSNLCIDGARWRTQHLPLIMRLYPFALARSSDDVWAMCYDASSPRLSLTEGEPLLQADGTSLRKIAGPTGLLPQAGGSLGMSANADFRFAAEGSDLPSALEVTFQKQTAHFKLQSKAPA